MCIHMCKCLCMYMCFVCNYSEGIAECCNCVIKINITNGPDVMSLEEHIITHMAGWQNNA